MQRTQLALLVCLVGLMTSAMATQAAAADKQAPPPQQLSEAGQEISGIVVSTMSVVGYTYVQLDTGDGTVWAAAPRTPVKEGDRVILPDGAPMPNFYSSSLGRRFEMIYFASSLIVHSGEDAAQIDLRSHCPPGEQDGADVDVSEMERAAGGKTISEIFEQKAELAGKEVTLRGKVIKCSSGILGMTWIHLRDGTTGPGGTDDVTITTTAAAAVGSTLLVRGTVVLDKDFGYGYRYDLLIEDATITIE